MTPDSIKEEVSKIRWYHTMDLGNGVITSGIYNPSSALPRFHFPESFHGKTVLDIGAWDGFYSFEAERRGAERVLATDSLSWSGQSWGSKSGFELARKVLNSKVEDMSIDVMELGPEKIGTFDVVLFLGVLYHLQNPLAALERVFSVTSDLLILDTHVDLLGIKRPAMAFYPGQELNNDSTNWVGPNSAAVLAMLKTVGFRRAEIVSPPAHVHSSPWRVANALLNLLKGQPFSPNYQQGRITVHASR
jgi:tRNA (mo5U34)-methyltransferase